jgi:hypothetical protein
MLTSKNKMVGHANIPNSGGMRILRFGGAHLPLVASNGSPDGDCGRS